jgi:hypothetical protein
MILLKTFLDDDVAPQRTKSMTAMAVRNEEAEEK